MKNYDKLLITKIKNSSISMYLCGYFIQKFKQVLTFIKDEKTMSKLLISKIKDSSISM